VPESQHFNLSRIALDTIVEMITDTAQVDTANTRKAYIRCDGPDVRLSRDELEGSFDRLAKGIRGGGTIQIPPG
jgi:hypothetical protein